VDLDAQAKQFIIEQGHRTVPQIYQDGALFVEGGYNGLARLSDESFKLLKESQNAN
jgi:hypothetical protein